MSSLSDISDEDGIIPEMTPAPIDTVAKAATTATLVADESFGSVDPGEDNLESESELSSTVQQYKRTIGVLEERIVSLQMQVVRNI